MSIRTRRRGPAAPHPHYFRPWLRLAADAAIALGVVAAVAGAVVALVGLHGEGLAADPSGPREWVTVGTWLTYGGCALGFVGVLVRYRR